MEEIHKTKADIRSEVAKELAKLPKSEQDDIGKKIENRLFEFANFLESKITLLYISQEFEVDTHHILKKAFDFNKIVVLPLIDADSRDLRLYKIDDFNNDLGPGENGIFRPRLERCKAVPIECIDIAIIPGIAFDEKGGRLGTGDGYYDRLIPKLPITTRKVALAFDQQIIPQVPTESHDKPVDIIITEKRIIYKI